MLLYNSLSGKKEKINKPLKGKSLRIFVCGPTVYDSPHIGHARTFLAFDMFVRFLRKNKIKVFYLQNITDVDDKIIVRSREKKISPFKLSSFYEKEYLNQMRKLGILSVNKYAKASDYIPNIVSQVKKLIKNNIAYKIENDGFYYDISKFSDYGKLSRRTVTQAEDSVSRIDENINKKNKGDFCLWKFVKQENTQKNKKTTARKNPILINNEPAWKTEIGLGRPGWHIEDTAITEKNFGPQYEIHGGAVDLKFPHHEAEIAQEEAISGKKPLAKFWMHTGMLFINGKKMSKSLKNFITIDEFMKKNGELSSNMLRMIVAQTHYRSPLNFKNETLTQAKESCENISDFIEKLKFVSERSIIKKESELTNKKLIELKNNFSEKLGNDFNTPDAIGLIFKFINGTYTTIFKLSKNDAKNTKHVVSELIETLGFSFKQGKVPKNILKLSEKRELSRQNKQFIQSDALRNKITALGYKVEDTPLGPFIKKKF